MVTKNLIEQTLYVKLIINSNKTLVSLTYLFYIYHRKIKYNKISLNKVAFILIVFIIN
jgi:hypothetical protein